MPFTGGYSSDDFRCNTGSQQYASKTGVYKVSYYIYPSYISKILRKI